MTERPRLYLHVGMGKTGTTSIQAALRSNTDALARAGLCNLSSLGEGYDTLPEATALQWQDADEQRRVATALCARMQAIREANAGSDVPIESFVYSNEGLFSAAKRIGPLIAALDECVDLRVIAFIRNPSDWLPSAYVQWGIKHKLEPGPVEAFADHARRHVRRYAAIDHWHDYVGDRMRLEPYGPSVDVVGRFGGLIGVEFTEPVERLLSRPEDAELVLRALFNGRLDNAALPKLFDEVILNTRLDPVPDRATMIDQLYDSEQVEAVVADNADVFARYEALYGFDVTGIEANANAPAADRAQIDARLIDYLLQMALRQGTRTHLLVHRVDGLRTEVEKLRGDVRTKSDQIEQNAREHRRRMAKIEASLQEMQAQQAVIRRHSPVWLLRRAAGRVARTLGLRRSHPS